MLREKVREKDKYCIMSLYVESKKGKSVKKINKMVTRGWAEITVKVFKGTNSINEQINHRGLINSIMNIDHSIIV